MSALDPFVDAAKTQTFSRRFIRILPARLRPTWRPLKLVLFVLGHSINIRLSEIRKHQPA
jgi:hypothetical protein